MTDPVVVTPPVEPPVTPPAPDPKPAEKKLLDDLKKWQAKAKALEEENATIKPVYEKFKGHEDAKALEATREAEARAKQESDRRAQQDVDSKKERAILRSLLGLVPPGDDELAEFAVWKMSTDPTITFDPETGTFSGLVEAREKLAASPRFAAATGEPARKPAPGLPDTKSRSELPTKISSVTSLLQLQTMPMEFQMEFVKAYPDRYAELRNESRASLARPLPPPPPPMAQPYRAPINVPSERK